MLKTPFILKFLIEERPNSKIICNFAPNSELPMHLTAYCSD
jgi:hypothetical protein